MANFFRALSTPVRYWYIPLIAGIIFIVFGIYIFTVPLETYRTLAMLFSIAFIVSGLTDIVFSVQNRKSLEGWGWYLVSGLLTLVIGIYLTVYPAISITVLPFFVGFTMLFRSFQLLGFSFDLKELNIVSWGNLALLSIAGVIFSLILLCNPFFTGISLVTITALTFIFVGVSSIILSLSLKKVKDFPGKISSELKDRIKAIQSEIDRHRREVK